MDTKTIKVDLYVKGAIDEEIKRGAKACAVEMGITFGSFVQQALVSYTQARKRERVPDSTEEEEPQDIDNPEA